MDGIVPSELVFEDGAIGIFGYCATVGVGDIPSLFDCVDFLLNPLKIKKPTTISMIATTTTPTISLVLLDSSSTARVYHYST